MDALQKISRDTPTATHYPVRLIWPLLTEFYCDQWHSKRGVKQGDTISTKLLIFALEEAFKNWIWKEKVLTSMANV